MRNVHFLSIKKKTKMNIRVCIEYEGIFLIQNDTVEDLYIPLIRNKVSVYYYAQQQADNPLILFCNLFPTISSFN